MQKIAYILCLVLGLSGCQEVQYPEPPQTLISQEKMVQILADAYISNASRSKGVNNRILRTKGIQLDSLLYTKHGIDSLTFAESNAYYASNLDQYTALITEVEKVISARKATLDSTVNAIRNRTFSQGDSTKVATEKPANEGQLESPARDDEE
ncbi:MAG: DUF4296 domain-containing protein [Bacteroidota bacterium]